MLDKILQIYLRWYASSKEVKFTCESKYKERPDTVHTFIYAQIT